MYFSNRFLRCVYSISLLLAGPALAVSSEPAGGHLELGLVGFNWNAAETAPVRLVTASWQSEIEPPLPAVRPAPVAHGLDEPETFEEVASGAGNTTGNSPVNVVTQPWTRQALPDGLMWHSYLAAPHEPRMSSVLIGDGDGDFFWDATLGGRVGLLRYGTTDVRRPQGWQWDLEGAVMTRLDNRHAEDVESMDYRFGTLITTAQGPWAAKAGYFHISSHVGDEYLMRNPGFERINYVTESLIVGGSYSPDDAWRLYGETALAVKTSGGARAWQFQMGGEWVPMSQPTRRSSPFAAVNLDVREAVGHQPTLTVQAGRAIRGTRSGKMFRYGLQGVTGPTSQFSFFRRRDDYLGLGVWYDF